MNKVRSKVDAVSSCYYCSVPILFSFTTLSQPSERSSGQFGMLNTKIGLCREAL